MSRRDGGVFIGMHFWGTDRRSLALPAWQILSHKNYRHAPRYDDWEMVTSDELFDLETPLDDIVLAMGEVTGFEELLPFLTVNHRYRDSILWRLTIDGVRIEDAPPEVTHGDPITVARVWQLYQSSLVRWCLHYRVPVELAIATICTETRGNASAIRREPGYVSDASTPQRISVGLMQTLISTGQSVVPDIVVDREWLLDSDNSIRAGVAYIAHQKETTFFDPPKVACAYNAGSVIYNSGQANRWKMRQYPIGSGDHADRFIRWFNDCFRYFDMIEANIEPSFRQLFRN